MSARKTPRKPLGLIGWAILRARVFWRMHLEPPRRRAERSLRMAEAVYDACAEAEAPYRVLDTLRRRVEWDREVVDMYRGADRQEMTR